MKGRLGGVIGACFGMAAFAVAVIAGMAAGRETAAILTRAILALIVCYPMGMIVGLICERVVDSHMIASQSALGKSASNRRGAAGLAAPAPGAPSKDEDVLVV